MPVGWLWPIFSGIAIIPGMKTASRGFSATDEFLAD